MMTDNTVPAPIQVEVEGVILRCTCENPESHVGRVCPQAKTESLGPLSTQNTLLPHFWGTWFKLMRK